MDSGMIARVMSAMRSASSSSNDEDRQPRVAMVIDVAENSLIGGFIPAIVEKQKHPYTRPEFLYFTEDEITLSADQSVRPVICPKCPEQMPLLAGYAEVINGGKTRENEDQACAKYLKIVQQGTEEFETVTENPECSKNEQRKLSDEDALVAVDLESSSGDSEIAKTEAVLFGIYDGHAGSGAALMASKCLHEHVKSRVSEVLETIVYFDREESYELANKRSESIYSITGADHFNSPTGQITSEALVVGALEAAFLDMDEQIAEEKQTWKIPGGCATICVLVLLGKIYVANAGDCRAVLATAEGAYQNPEYIGSSFSRLEYSRSLTKKDLKKKVLYKDWFMDGWASKTVRDADLRPPMISDRLRKVNVLSIRSLPSVSALDVLIVASDGLWDVLTNEEAAKIVRSALSSLDEHDPSRYTQAAQELVAAARGNPGEHRRWTLSVGGQASMDDISAFVIPLKHALAPPRHVDDEDDEELLSLDS